MTTTRTRTRTIAGEALTLTVGRRYLASRPMASRGLRLFDVFIADITDDCGTSGDRLVLLARSYEQANRILRAFNDGATSFEGRIW